MKINDFERAFGITRRKQFSREKAEPVTIKRVGTIGNASGIYLPKDWFGKSVGIFLLEDD